MAGGLLKTFGILMIVLGALALLAGLAAAGYGYTQGEDENEKGLLQDGEKSDQYQAFVTAGLAGAGVGVLLLLLGIILTAAGGARAQSALRRDIREATAPGAGAASAAAASTAPTGPSTGGPPAAGWAAQGSAAEARAPGKGNRGAIGAVFVVIGLVLAIALAAWLFAGNGDELVNRLGGDDPDDASEPRELGNQTFPGTLSSGVTVLGGSQLAGDGDSELPFKATEGTARITVKVDWTPSATGVKAMQVYVDRDNGGAWELLADETGGPGIAFEVAHEALSGASMRLRLFPGEDGAQSGQDFTATVTMYDA